LIQLTWSLSADPGLNDLFQRRGRRDFRRDRKEKLTNYETPRPHPGGGNFNDFKKICDFRDVKYRSDTGISQAAQLKQTKPFVVSRRLFWLRFIANIPSFQGAKDQMTYIVAEPCVNCRYTDCALVCPVEAFHLDDDMLVINPETCIDCDACVPECPVEAVFSEAALPAEWSSFTAINAERALSGLPTITARLDPLCE
jgi:ferredoxin